MRVIHHLIYLAASFPSPEPEPEACAPTFESAEKFATDFMEVGPTRITLLVSVNDEGRLFQPCPICDRHRNRLRPKLAALV